MTEDKAENLGGSQRQVLLSQYEPQTSTATSSRNILEMQSMGLHPSPPESDTLRVGSRNLCPNSTRISAVISSLRTFWVFLRAFLCSLLDPNP